MFNLKSYLYLIILGTIISCSKDDSNADIIAELNRLNDQLEEQNNKQEVQSTIDSVYVDFSLSIIMSYSSGYKYELTGNNGSSNIPEGSTFTWKVDGYSVGSSSSFSDYINEGQHAVSLCITTPSGTQFCESKTAYTYDDKIYYDPIEIGAVVCDFSYSVTYSADSSYVTIGMADNSSLYSSEYDSYWIINGEIVYPQRGGYPLNTNNHDDRYTVNGLYSITHDIYVDGIKYSSSKQFEVNGVK